MPERKLLESFNKQVNKISFPCELVNHCRSVRPLTDLKDFKANEFFNYLFYVGVILLRSRVPDKVYNHYLQLVYGVRLLWETSVEDEIQVAEACLDSFCREAVDNFGTEKCERSNLHCLWHLKHQVRQFGPLFVSSVMCFESANRLLVRLFTGTVSQCEVKSRRYLENQAPLEEEIENDVLSDVAASWSGQTSFPQSDRTFKQDVLETESVNAARVVYRESTIFSRALVGNMYFDSLCYRRNCRAPNGNVLLEKDGRWEWRKKHYFMSLPDSPSKYVFMQIY